MRNIEPKRKGRALTEEQARAIQNFGEQHPDFKNAEMKRWRGNWKKSEAPIKYGDYDAMETKDLSSKREVLMDLTEEALGSKDNVRVLHELMEVERELTLRENE